MKTMKTLLERVKAFLWCEYDWVFIKHIDDRNLRYGYEHKSDVFMCSKCYRFKTVELENFDG